MTQFWDELELNQTPHAEGLRSQEQSLWHCGRRSNQHAMSFWQNKLLPMRFELMISRLLSERLSQLGQGSC